MKTITDNIKAKYFALYYYRQVLGKYVNSDELAPIEIMNPCLVDYIELTKIEDISDDDAIEVFNIIGISNHLSNESKAIQCKELFATNRFYNQQTNIPAIGYLRAFQYLQSKGYALPYLDYSVSDLVELGLIKLKK